MVGAHRVEVIVGHKISVGIFSLGLVLLSELEDQQELVGYGKQMYMGGEDQ